jgi:hypothetical protein
MEPSALESLRAPVEGEVIAPGDAGFAEARTIWNAMIDREPAAVVRPKNAGDVAEAIAFARGRAQRSCSETIRPMLGGTLPSSTSA